MLLHAGDNDPARIITIRVSLCQLKAVADAAMSVAQGSTRSG